jgi:hypothetical protein
MKMLSVTTVLSPFSDFSKVPPERLEYAKNRGTSTHSACAAYALGLPVFLSNGADPYFESFKNWADKYVKKFLFVEAEFSDPTTYGIVGHLDAVVELIDGRTVVPDYKTPATESPCWKSQISTYCHLAAPVLGLMPDGMALMLDGKGKAARGKFYQYQAADFANFLAALQAWRAFK